MKLLLKTSFNFKAEKRGWKSSGDSFEEIIKERWKEVYFRVWLQRESSAEKGLGKFCWSFYVAVFPGLERLQWPPDYFLQSDSCYFEISHHAEGGLKQGIKKPSFIWVVQISPSEKDKNTSRKRNKLFLYIPEWCNRYPVNSDLIKYEILFSSMTVGPEIDNQSK